MQKPIQLLSGKRAVKIYYDPPNADDHGSEAAQAVQAYKHLGMLDLEFVIDPTDYTQNIFDDIVDYDLKTAWERFRLPDQQIHKTYHLTVGNGDDEERGLCNCFQCAVM